MLTLDTLARMATRMPTEALATEQDPPYRRPDAMRTRQVELPSVREEAGRALRLFVFGVTVPVVILSVTGVLATHVGQIAEGLPPDAGLLARTALWYACWTLLFVAPPAAWALSSEVLRFAQVRSATGPFATVDSAARIRRRDGGGPWMPLRR